MTAASNVLAILAAQAHGLLKSHAPRWIPTYLPNMIRPFRQLRETKWCAYCKLGASFGQDSSPKWPHTLKNYSEENYSRDGFYTNYV